MVVAVFKTTTKHEPPGAKKKFGFDLCNIVLLLIFRLHLKPDIQKKNIAAFKLMLKCSTRFSPEVLLLF